MRSCNGVTTRARVGLQHRTMLASLSEGLFGSPSSAREGQEPTGNAATADAAYAGEPVGTLRELTLLVEYPSFGAIPYKVQVWPWETIFLFSQAFLGPLVCQSC